MPPIAFRVTKHPSIVALAMEVAPAVRLGFITDEEGSRLVDLRYAIARAEIAERDEPTSSFRGRE